MGEKVIFSLLGLGVHGRLFFRHYLFASASFLFFRADPHANVMAWLWHHLRRRSADQTHPSGSHRTPEAKRSKKSRRKSKGRSVMPATVESEIIFWWNIILNLDHYCARARSTK